MVPAQGVQFAHVGEFAQGSVGLGGVPLDGAAVTHGGFDHLGELADGDLLAAADVDVAVAHFVALAAHVLKVNVLQTIDAGVGHVLAPQELADGSSGAPQAQAVGENAVFLKCGDDLLLDGVAVDVFDGSARQVGADAVHIALVEHFCQVHFPNHGGHDVAGLKVEVVARAVQVGGHHGDEVGAVLQVKALAHLQAGDFGDGVGLVGVFQGRGEQCVLADRLGCLAGIDAGAAQKEEFLHAVTPALADDVLLDGEVLEDEVGAVFQVCHDAAYVGCREHDIFGPFLVKEALYRRGIHQVEFLVCASDEVGVALALQAVPDGASHESAVAGDVYFGVFVHDFYLKLRITRI